jgi:nucleoid-associated protein EbfC
MKNINQMMKQAQEFQKKVAEMQERLNLTEMEGTSGAGMVKVVMNGKGDLRSLKIDPTDVEVLEDLIVAAYNDAKTKIDTHMSEEMGKVTGGLNLPSGFKLPF